MQDQKQELQERYEEDWRQCEQVLPFRNGIMEYLGALDADLQWSCDEVGAYETFLKIGGYNKFIRNDYLILAGRTGTGKSCILKMYAHAVNTGERKHISVAIIIKIERLVKQLKQFSDDFRKKTNEYLEECIENCVELLIKLCVMQKLVEISNEEDVEIHQELQQISKYLQSKHIISETDIVKKISTELDFCHGQGVHLGTAVNNLIRAYSDINSSKNQRALKIVLDRHKVLVLLGSDDCYDVTDRCLAVMNKVLVELAFSYNDMHKKENIVLKTAMSSEAATAVIEQLPGKKKGRVLVIEWKNKDLIKMLAIKIFYFFSNEKYLYAEPFIKNYQIEDFCDDEKAMEFLHKMLPERCSTSISVNFDTILYCIMHTQKKPRQIIAIFNSFLDKICEEEQFDYFITHSDEIAYYIHRTQSDIICDALSVYNIITEGKLMPILRSVLIHKRNVMDEDEFTNAIRDALDSVQDNKLKVEDVRQFLIQSGLIGQIYNENYISSKSELLENDYVIKISSALFEYQIEGTLPIVNGGKYVLHPMCYAYYGNEIDHNTLVYPEPIDDSIMGSLKMYF